MSVLKQLSTSGLDETDPLSLQTVRYALKAEAVQATPDIEGSSLLFYYLFDDWRAVYSTVGRFHLRLDNLVWISIRFSIHANLLKQNAIFDDMVSLLYPSTELMLNPLVSKITQNSKRKDHPQASRPRTSSQTNAACLQRVQESLQSGCRPQGDNNTGKPKYKWQPRYHLPVSESAI